MEVQGYIILLVWLLFVLLLGTLGFYISSYPEKSLGFLTKLYDKINLFGTEPFWEPDRMVPFYQIVGGILMLISGIGTITVLYIFWQVLIKGVEICVGRPC